MWRRVDIVLTDVSEERIASIFRVEEKEENPRARNQRDLATGHLLFTPTFRNTVLRIIRHLKTQPGNNRKLE
jgi:hypothetical protein